MQPAACESGAPRHRHWLRGGAGGPGERASAVTGQGPRPVFLHEFLLTRAAEDEAEQVVGPALAKERIRPASSAVGRLTDRTYSKSKPGWPRRQAPGETRQLRAVRRPCGSWDEG